MYKTFFSIVAMSSVIFLFFLYVRFLCLMNITPKTQILNILLILCLFLGVINGVYRVLFKLGMKLDTFLQNDPILLTYWEELAKKAAKSSYSFFKNLSQKTATTPNNGGPNGPQNSQLFNRSQLGLGVLGVTLAAGMLYEVHTHNERTYQLEKQKIDQEYSRQTQETVRLAQEEIRLRQEEERLQLSRLEYIRKAQESLDKQRHISIITEETYQSRQEELYKKK